MAQPRFHANAGPGNVPKEAKELLYWTSFPGFVSRPRYQK